MKPASLARVLVAGASFVLLADCSSDATGPVGGPFTGPVDMHCFMNDSQIKQPIGQCLTGAVDAGTAVEPDAAAGEDGGAVQEPAVTMNNSEGDDDDCKYHVKWTSSLVRRNADATFDVNLKRLADGMAATGGQVSIEAFLDQTHPTPSTTISTTESAGGNYKVGPVRFDAEGKWTVRFHFYESCSDIPEDSPHGHAAFYVVVP